MGINEMQSNVDLLLKENTQMKGEIFRLSSLLGSRELEIKSMSEKFKLKLAGIKKELKNKENNYPEKLKDIDSRIQEINKNASRLAQSRR